MADLDDLIQEATRPKRHRVCWLCANAPDHDHPARVYLRKVREVHNDPTQPRIVFNQVCRVIEREWGMTISPNTVTKLVEGTVKCHTTI